MIWMVRNYISPLIFLVYGLTNLLKEAARFFVYKSCELSSYISVDTDEFVNL